MSRILMVEGCWGCASLEQDQIMSKLTEKWIVISQARAHWRGSFVNWRSMRTLWELPSMYLLVSIAPRLLWSPKLMAEESINSIFKLFPTCQAYFWVTYSFVIFIHSKMSISDNALLFSMKREHCCLNMGEVPFPTVEGNDSIFELISGEKEVCKLSLSCCSTKCIT